jgi:predicted aspartyl protease
MSGWTRREGLLALAAGLVRPGAVRAADAATVEVGLNEARSRFFLEVAINGQAGFRFVLDTGASAHFVSQRVADQLALLAPTSRFARGFDGRNRVAVAQMGALRVGGVELGRSEAAIWPDQRVSGFDGLIGYPYLAPRAVIDLKAQRLSLGSRGDGPGLQVRAEVDSRSAVLIGGMPGVEGRFAFDTGAQAFTISRRYHERLQGTPAYRDAAKVTLNTAGGPERLLGFRPAVMTFGDFAIARPAVIVAPDDDRQGAFEWIDGLIGVSLLRRYVWAIDPAEGRLRVLGEA